MQYLLTTIKGLEDISLQEFKTKGKIVHPGKILFASKDIDRIIYNTRSLIRITKVLAEFKFETYEDILKRFKETKWKIKDTYRVQCFREGNHEFNSQDIMSEGHAFLKGKIDFKNPKTTLAIEIVANHCYFGYLKANDLNKRYKVKTHKTDVNSCLAFLLIKLLDYKPKETLFDPYCGCGTLLIEAALYAKNIAPQHLKNPIKKFDKIKEINPKITGFDDMLYNIKNTRINAKLAQVDLDLHNCTIDWAETKLRKIDKVITYLSKNHEQEFQKTISQLAPHAKILVITTNKEFNVNEKEYKCLKRTAQVGGTIYYILCYQKKNSSNKEKKN